MKRCGVPDMALLVFGDWQTVISSKQYREELLDQRPDEEMADWSQYRISCDTVEKLVEAYNEFRVRLKLHCDFGFLMKAVSAGGDVQVDLITGFGGDQKPQCWVTVNESTSAVSDAANKAIEILKAAIE
jgi:hypothetical protein